MIGMEDLNLTVHHRAHWEWVKSDDAKPDEETRPVHPNLPDRLVKRLIPGDSVTEISIPAEGIARMVRERAEWEGTEPTVRHLHDILAIHVHDSLRQDHAPVHAWHKVECDDEDIQKMLHERFIAPSVAPTEGAVVDASV